MTIAVAIRTGSAVVFAADSKITTVGVVGVEEDGSPRVVDQTYDNATKVAHDVGKTMMVMVAGYANIGRVAATDFISITSFGRFHDKAQQDKAIEDLVVRMMAEHRAYWEGSQVPEADWPGPTLLLAAPGPAQMSARVWRIGIRGTSPAVDEVLTFPHVRLEGSYNETFGLLFGYEPTVLAGLAREVGVEEKRLWEAGGKPRVLRPIDKINFGAMPLQDAIEMAVFLAGVQVQMDRFLPGTPACGGLIDVMVLRMAPGPEILVFPGKTLHHPSFPR